MYVQITSPLPVPSGGTQVCTPKGTKGAPSNCCPVLLTKSSAIASSNFLRATMCVLKPCAKPTGVGVWWRDDTRFVQYGKTQADAIIEGVRNKLASVDLGTITSHVHPRGARYAADLQKMEQVAVSSGQRRDILIIEPPTLPSAHGLDPAPPPMLDNKPANPGGPSFSPTVHFRDSSGQLHQYGAQIGNALLHAVVRGGKRKVVLHDSGSGDYLLFDLEAMLQYDVSRSDGENGGEPVVGNAPPVEVVIEIPWNPMAMVAVAKEADAYARRQILVMVVDRYRSEMYLDAILPVKAHPRNILSKKTDTSLQTGHPAYEKFIDTLETVATRVPNGLELLMKGMESASADADGSIMRVAFKPASKSPSCENTSFWMSMLAPAAAVHAAVYGCAVHLRILVYFVILPLGALTRIDRTGLRSDHVTVHNPHHKLHVGEVVVN